MWDCGVEIISVYGWKSSRGRCDGSDGGGGTLECYIREGFSHGVETWSTWFCLTEYICEDRSVLSVVADHEGDFSCFG